MFTHVNAFLRRLRRRLSLSEWLARKLRLSIKVPKQQEPGLILIQIDGLSHQRLKKALESGQMPFLRQLTDRDRYRLWQHYSGIPSSTPAVQGEIFYGIRQCVPAFKYRDYESGEVFLFHWPISAAHIEKRLQQTGSGLLSGGSSYGNIFSGGAEESHFCLSTLGSQSYWRTFYPYAWLLVLVLNPLNILRAVFTAAFELLAVFHDKAKGHLGRRDFFEELRAIPVRIFVAIFLREFMTMGSRIDIARGFGIIHLNYFGYDELAHRYGERSLFADIALRDIDRSIRKIWNDATKSVLRDYDLWIFSDHGQEKTRPYRLETGRAVEDAVEEVFQTLFPQKPHGIRKPMITARGPLGFVYLKYRLTEQEKEKIARALVWQAEIPLVFTMGQDETVYAWTAEGRFILPGEGQAVFGKAHPYLEEVSREMADLCRNPHAGPFILSGWRIGDYPLSFPVERGSHGGPGPEETGGFALLPMDCPARPRKGRTYLRPSDLREGAMLFREGQKRETLYRRLVSKGPDEPLRVMSYNVHSCIGMDRKLAPERIARVIARHEPDVVCLQELDRGRFRTGGAHQAELIASMLDMTYHFYPVLRIEEEEYGDAILSRYPMRLIRADSLARFEHVPDLEPRGALWVEIDFFGQKVQVLNTHLSLLSGERDMQIQDLLGPGWLGHEQCRPPVIFCGDLNIQPGASSSRLLRRKFKDIPLHTKPAQAAKTWPTFFPFLRLDYIYASDDLEVAKVDVPAMTLEKVASDHFPVIADLRIGTSI